jgi:hypothetical protein
MSAADALRDIRGYAAANRARFTRHAYDEMVEAGATEEDVMHALAYASRCRPGNIAGRWKVTGPDLDGDDLDVVVVIQSGLLVVTVM